MGVSIATWRADGLVVEIILNPDGRLSVDQLGLGLSDSGVLASPLVRREMSGQDWTVHRRCAIVLASNSNPSRLRTAPKIAARLSMLGLPFSESIR
jgi:hypothetical protein